MLAGAGRAAGVVTGVTLTLACLATPVATEASSSDVAPLGGRAGFSQKRSLQVKGKLMVSQEKEPFRV